MTPVNVPCRSRERCGCPHSVPVTFAGLSRPGHMNIAIVGGTGTVGAEAARVLTARGHAVRVLSRHAPEYPVDLSTGAGLARALDGVEVVVDASNGSAQGAASRARSGCCAPSATAGVAPPRRRLDRRHRPRRRAATTSQARPGGGDPRAAAYRGRSCARRSSTRSWRSAFAASARLGVVPSVSAPLQPVDPREVGRALAETAEAEPSLAITQFAGPGGRRASRELARRWREATGSHARAGAAARDALAARRRADQPRRLARQGHLRRVAGVMTDSSSPSASRRCGRGCCGSPTGSSAASPRPRTSCRTRGCGCSASTPTRSATSRAG